MAMSSPLVHLDGQCRVIANGATTHLDNPACVKLDYAAAWYSWMIPPSTSRRPMSLSDRRAVNTGRKRWRPTIPESDRAGPEASPRKPAGGRIGVKGAHRNERMDRDPPQGAGRRSLQAFRLPGVWAGLVDALQDPHPP